MQQKILQVFTTYVNDNKLTTENLDDTLQNLSFIKFFNDITVSILGKPLYTHDKSTNTSGAITYISEASKERFVTSVDIINFNSLYYGILTRLEYNYDNYSELIIELPKVRNNLKKEFLNNKNKSVDTTQVLIKSYMNLIYGMIDNSTSILTSSHESPREFISTEAKKLVLSIVSFLMNKTIPVYYVETDEIHIKHISSEIWNEVLKYYNTLSDIIDLSITTIDREQTALSAYYLAKKRYLVGSMSTVGMKEVDNQLIHSQNKKYFGRNYPDLFPEYAL